MTAESTIISVVIPARKDAGDLPLAVASVLSQSEAVAEVVIAIGPSDDDTRAVAEQLAAEHPEVQIVANVSGKTPEALNLAIAASTGNIIARVDARSILPSGYLAAAIETLRATGAANVGAIQDPQGRTPTQRAIAAAMRSPLGSGGAAYRGTKEPTQAKTAYLGVFRRAPLEQVGGFDESFIRNQDAELNLRLVAAGEQVWVDPRMVVAYLARPSLKTLASQFYQYGWWRRITIQRHAVVQTRQLIPPAVCGSVVGAMLVAPLYPIALAVPATYVAGVAAAVATADDLSVPERTTMAAALATMHFSWSSGFLRSSLEIAVRKLQS